MTTQSLFSTRTIKHFAFTGDESIKALCQVKMNATQAQVQTQEKGKFLILVLVCILASKLFSR